MRDAAVWRTAILHQLQRVVLIEVVMTAASRAPTQWNGIFFNSDPAARGTGFSYIKMLTGVTDFCKFIVSIGVLFYSREILVKFS